jgi:hypothetical protein
MNATITNDVLAEVWEAKDSLSAIHGHDLAATCRALYAEQEKRPGSFVILGTRRTAEHLLSPERQETKAPE